MDHRFKNWRGEASILPGIGVFVGRSGDTVAHKHWAHQISISLEGDLVVLTGNQSITGRALFIQANTTHSLQSSLTLSIYIDPSTVLAKKLISLISNHSSVCEMPFDLAYSILDFFKGSEDVSNGLRSLQQSYSSAENTRLKKRTDIVLNRLQGILKGAVVTRNELAELTCLSPSRFSHWFKEETGLPLRSYRKWLHLIYGIEIILAGESLNKAAYTANFSDQAHFTRTFKQAFGESPHIVLANIQSMSKS